MPNQTHRTSSVPIPQRKPEQLTSGAGFSNSALLEMLGLSGGRSEEVPMRSEQSGQSETLPQFAGYDSPWHQANDALIIEVVQEFNAEKGWDPSHPSYLDPALVKAWALQESGGHKDVFAQGDMMQMNVPGDWVPEKQNFGLSSKREQIDPRKSLRIALRWAYYKGEVTRAKLGEGNGEGWHDTQRGTKSVPGYESRFTNWDNALDDYNGGGVENYSNSINRRMDTARR